MRNATHRLLWTAIALFLVVLGAFGLALSLGAVAGTDPDAPLLWSGLLRWWHGSAPWPAVASTAAGLFLALLGHRILDHELRPDAGPITGELALACTPPASPTSVTPAAPPPPRPTAPAPPTPATPPAPAPAPAPAAATPMSALAAVTPVSAPAALAQGWADTGPSGPGGQTRIGAGVLARALARDLNHDRRIRHARVVLTGTPPRPELWIRLRVDPGVATADVRAEVAAALRRFVATSGFQPASLDVTAYLGDDHTLT